MEGPLVSDTTEILSGAPTAPEDAPAAAGATASTSKSRSRGGSGLSSLLMPELQRIAQTLAIPGAGRMRKSQLIEAIEARQGGGPRQETSAARKGSDQRAASAGADAARLQKQDAMEPDTHSRPGIGASAQSGLGDGTPAGIGADGAAQQQLSFYEEADSAARRDSVAQDGAAPAAAAAAEAAQGDTQRGDRRRRNGQPSRSRDQGSRDQSGRDQGSREGGREQVSRDQGISRDQGSREQSRDHGSRDQSGRDQVRDSRDQGRDGRDQGGDRRDQGRDGRDQGGDRREPAAAGRGSGGDQFRDDDGDGRRG